AGRSRPRPTAATSAPRTPRPSPTAGGAARDSPPWSARRWGPAPAAAPRRRPHPVRGRSASWLHSGTTGRQPADGGARVWMREPCGGMVSLTPPHCHQGGSAPTMDGVSTGTVLLAEPRGYCAGVDRAVVAVERALEHYDETIYVRHEIVHNKFVVDRLKEKGDRKSVV